MKGIHFFLAGLVTALIVLSMYGIAFHSNEIAIITIALLRTLYQFFYEALNMLKDMLSACHL